MGSSTPNTQNDAYSIGTDVWGSDRYEGRRTTTQREIMQRQNIRPSSMPKTLDRPVTPNNEPKGGRDGK